MTRSQAEEVITGLGFTEAEAKRLAGEAVASLGRRVDLGGRRWVRYDPPSAANTWDRRGGFSVARAERG